MLCDGVDAINECVLVRDLHSEFGKGKRELKNCFQHSKARHTCTEACLAIFHCVISRLTSRKQEVGTSKVKVQELTTPENYVLNNQNSH